MLLTSLFLNIIWMGGRGRTKTRWNSNIILNKAVNSSLLMSNKAPQLKEFHGSGEHRQYSNSLWAALFTAQIPAGVSFSASVLTHSGVHSASYTMGTGSFPSVKWLGCGVGPPPPSSTLDIESVKLYLSSHSVPSWQVIRWTSPFYFTKELPTHWL